MPILPSDAHVGEVRLRVADLNRSAAFYTEVIGFAILDRGPRHLVLGPAAGRVLLRIDAEPGARPRSPRTSGLFHFAILVPDRAALGRSLRRLADQRWPLTGASDHLVSEALYLNDPDGLGIEIYRDRPADTWTRDGGEVIMATEPLDLDSVAGEAGAERPWSGLDAGTAIGHVHLHVPDLAGAEAFYCGGIGLSPTLRRYPGALFVAAGTYHHHLGLNTWAGRGVPPPAAGTVGLVSFTIEGTGVAPRSIDDEATGVRVVCGAMG